MKKVITLGTDFSGIDAPFHALIHLSEKMKFKVNYRFASEIQAPLRAFLKQLDPCPHRVYNSIESRLAETSEAVDLYVAGFPCQSFSTLGNQKGIRDPRGQAFFYILEYLKKYQPTVFLLENVKALTTHNKGKTFETVMKYLCGLNTYSIDYRVLSPDDVGFPHKRARTFIIGIKHSQSLKFEWPSNPTSFFTSLDALLMDRKSASELHPSCCRPLCPSAIRNLAIVNDTIKNWGDSDIHCIVNLGMSTRFLNKPNPDVCPCLRQNCCDYYIVQQDRYLSWREALRLQGFPDSVFPKVRGKNSSRQSELPTARQVYAYAGNSICIPLLVAILKPVIHDLVVAK
jgi:DNA (cytosine-5)-methyltransferase 1